MAKRVIILMILTFGFVFSQDTVYLKNGKEVKCSVQAIHPETVEVMPSDGTAIEFIAKSKIRAVLYENGKMKFFDEAVKEEKKDNSSVEKQAAIRTVERNAKNDGMVAGIGICCAIFLLLSLIGGGGGA